MVAPAVVGTPGVGSIRGNGSFTTTLPAGSPGSWLAIVTNGAGGGTLAPPSQFTEVLNTGGAVAYYATSTPGTTWSVSGIGATSAMTVVVIGLSIPVVLGTPAWGIDSLVSPGITSPAEALILRALFGAGSTNGTVGYPAAATLGRQQAVNWASGIPEKLYTAVALQAQATAGSVASASWTLPNRYGSDALTLALTAAATPPPATPTGLAATGGDREVDISFNASVGADSYLLRWRRTDLTPPGATTQTSAPGHLVRINSLAGSGSVYQYTYNGAGTLVCAIDSGLRTTHQEFTGRVVTGLSLGQGPWNVDSMNHGTPVSANAVGTTFGVAKGAQITMTTPEMGELTFDPDDLLDALEWVLTLRAANPTRPIVLTNSGPVPGYQEGGARIPALDDAIEAVLDAGIPIVMAIGNDDIDVTSRLAGGDPRIIWVGSTTTAGVRTDSAYATQLTLYAPCVGQTTASSASDTATQTWGYGTSGAAPMVSGVIAKIRQANPDLSPARIKEVLSSQGFDVVTSVPAGPTLMLNAQSQSSEWSTHPTTATSFTFDGLDVDATYEFQVAAVGVGGTSAWSTSVSASTDGVPAGGFSTSFAFGPAAASGDAPTIPVPEGAFAAAFAFGPAAAAGIAPAVPDAEGTFTTGVAFGPAEAVGEADASGAVTGAFSFGPAVASGESPLVPDAEGAFSTSFSFGPASAAGQAPIVPDAGGGFTSTFSFGPASGAGSTDVEGGFDTAFSFGPAEATGQAPLIPGAGGAFTTGFSFGPASSVGEASTEGGFAAAFSFGPVSAQGQAPLVPGAGGAFATTFRFGPATTKGRVHAEAEFAATFAFGPAASAGEAPAVPGSGGAFTTAFTFGPAEAGGLVEVEGAFAAGFAFGPAAAVGHVEAGGGFATGYLFGPATAGSVVLLPFPDHRTLTLDLPHRTLDLSLPVRTLDWSL